MEFLESIIITINSILGHGLVAGSSGSSEIRYYLGLI